MGKQVSAEAQYIIVNELGAFLRCGNSVGLHAGECIAVSIAALFDAESQNIVLLERSSAITDLPSKIALLAGKLDAGDAAAEILKIGEELPRAVPFLAMVREISEEIGLVAKIDRLRLVDKFPLPGRERFFFLFLYFLRGDEVKKIIVRKEENTRILPMSQAQFANVQNVGDVLGLKKALLEQLLFSS